jgi:EAL and modified HD-GYP domain-containing signal transduction protein
VLGENGVRRWIALATLPMLATSKPGELITLSIVRARFCERLAQLGGFEHHGDAFMMGMFSLLDALIDCPLDAALREVELESGITDALLGIAAERDRLASIYRLARRYEVGDWDEIEALSRDCQVPAVAVGAAYVESTLWAESLLGRGGADA